VGIYSFQAGAGPFGAIVVGFNMVGFILVVGQYAFSVARSPVLRLVIGLLFALSAARARYDAALALAYVGVSPGWWREVFAVFGAITVGGTAWARVSILTEPRSGWECCPGPSPVTDRGSDQGQVTPWIRRLLVGISANSQPVNMTAMSWCHSHFD
jgi:hypothetical protein